MEVGRNFSYLAQSAECEQPKPLFDSASEATECTVTWPSHGARAKAATAFQLWNSHDCCESLGDTPSYRGREPKRHCRVLAATD